MHSVYSHRCFQTELFFFLESTSQVHKLFIVSIGICCLLAVAVIPGSKSPCIPTTGFYCDARGKQFISISKHVIGHEHVLTIWRGYGGGSSFTEIWDTTDQEPGDMASGYIFIWRAEARFWKDTNDPSAKWIKVAEYTPRQVHYSYRAEL